ncbi:uncharacterized protein LOC132299948 isoform X1 [Cornus florida]|uniref:uncharacterized protein LOC132299948 isoform X1 n=1 Tax=Cornus florida TaxID=4283 RepID=UPI0028A0A90D|nr:uncharacterized protein LOC132299948 isoform X1 [Cornus florida]
MAFFVGKDPSDVDDDDDADSSFIDPDIIFDGSLPFYGKSGSKCQLIEISIEDLDTYVNNLALDKEDSPTIPSENANGNQNIRFRGVKNGGLEGMHGTSSLARGNTSDGGGHSLTMKHSPGGKMDTYQALHNNDEDGAFIEEAQRSLHAWEMNSLSYKECSSRDWIGWNLASAEYLEHALEWSSNEENDDISPYLVGIGHQPRTLKGRRGTSSMARGNTSDGGASVLFLTSVN